MLCEICGEWSIDTVICNICQPVFADFDKFPFSTATIQIQFSTNFFKTKNPPVVRNEVKKLTLPQKAKRELIDKAQRARKQELLQLFTLFEQRGEYTTHFKGDATRATTTLLQKRNKQLKIKKKKDSFYNSVTIKKGYETGGVQFKTSCLLFFNSFRITLGMWMYRKQVASDYIRLIRSVLKSYRFKVTGMKTIFVNVAFKFSPRCMGILPPLNSPLSNELTLTKNINLVVFNLSHVYETLKEAYEKTSDVRTLNYSPWITNQNKIHVRVIDRGGGCVSLYRTGTIMLLGFSKITTIIEEFQFLANILQKKFRYPLENQVELYKRKKIEMSGCVFSPEEYPKFLI